MKLSQIISFCDAIKPNAFGHEAKAIWISECEGIIHTEVFLLQPEDFEPLPTDGTDVQLSVKPPHDKLYQYYLCAMIDFANGEYDKYQNTLAMFNKCLNEYCRWYCDNLRPADGQAIRRGYYLTAYGLALSHGYEGTEGQWLESLKGERGEPGSGFRVMGFYDTVEELETGVEDPEVGDAYAVGDAEPYDNYIWDGAKWRNYGTFKGEPGQPGAPGSPGDKGDPGDSGVYVSESEDDPPDGDQNVWIIDSDDDDGIIIPNLSVERVEGGVRIIADSESGVTEETIYDGRSFVIKGYYATFSALTTAVSDPVPGDVYGVGASTPYDLYIWDDVGEMWRNNGSVAGVPGADGYTPTVSATKSEKTTTVTIVNKTGTTTATILDGLDGQDGYTPVRGTDYWTASDKAEIVQDVLDALPTWNGGDY